MKANEDHLERMVDLLLCELVGREEPPDVRARVREAAEGMKGLRGIPARSVVPLPSTRRSKAPALAIAALVALLATAAVFVQIRRVAVARTPVVTEISGEVSFPASRLSGGDRLTTGPSARAVLTYRDGSVVVLGPDSSVMIGKSPVWDRSKLIEMEAGSLRATVVPQPEGNPLVIDSGDATATVVGTLFSVDRDAVCSRLEVTEGSVRFDPHSGEPDVLVEAGHFAEAGRSGFRHGKIAPPPRAGITHFTLMNADTDQPLREEPLTHGETLVLSSFPTDRINIRADYEGDPPISVETHIRRHMGNPTGLGVKEQTVHLHPPYFVAGDHWAEGRPQDCAAWTPPPGLYHLTAEVVYADPERQALADPLTVTFRVSR